MFLSYNSARNCRNRVMTILDVSRVVEFIMLLQNFGNTVSRIFTDVVSRIFCAPGLKVCARIFRKVPAKTGEFVLTN